MYTTLLRNQPKLRVPFSGLVTPNTLESLCLVVAIFTAATFAPTATPSNECAFGPAFRDRGLDLQPDDLKALLALRESWKTSTPGLVDNWLDVYHPCTWCGIFCDCGDVRRPPPLHTVPGVCCPFLNAQPTSGCSLGNPCEYAMPR